MNMNLRKILNILLVIIMIYCLFSIVRSIGLLFLTYNDKHFFDADFNRERLMHRTMMFLHVYHYMTYIVGLGISIFMITTRLFKMKWFYNVLNISLGLILFWLIDARYIRPLFAFFEDIRINIWIILFTFLIIGTAIFFFYKKYWRI